MIWIWRSTQADISFGFYVNADRSVTLTLNIVLKRKVKEIG